MHTTPLTLHIQIFEDVPPVAFHALVLAEAVGAITLKHKERVEQPGPVHARES